MKRKWLTTVKGRLDPLDMYAGALAILLFLGVSGPVSADLCGGYDSGLPYQLILKEPYVPNRIVIKVSSGVRPDREDYFLTAIVNLMNRSQDIKKIRGSMIPDYYIAETVEGRDIEALCSELRRDPLVLDASPDYYAVLASTIPKDPIFELQYALRNTGQVYLPEIGISGESGCDIKASYGWDVTTGSADVIVAIIDSGVAWNHEDLINKVVDGYNFVDDNNNPYDDHGHGTFAASIAAAESDNGIGIAGVSWHSKIMPVKVMSSSGYGSYLAIASGIRYAVDHGAHVLNLSIGGRSRSFILEDACEYAHSGGAVIIAATGNMGSSVMYPAAYDDFCIAVAATDANDNRLSWSNYGPQVDVAAPGYFVWGASFKPSEPENLSSYGLKSGTSFAAPHVAGAAALLIGYDPDVTNDEVIDLIRATADDVNQAAYPGVDDFIGFGRINISSLLYLSSGRFRSRPYPGVKHGRWSEGRERGLD